MSEKLFNTYMSEDEAMENDVWDDNLLIKAYNKAVDIAKDKIAKKMSQENGINLTKEEEASPSKRAVKSKQQVNTPQEMVVEWAEGMPCRATYSEDGLEYEATVKEVFARQGTCLVVYVGYENEEEVDISTLKPSRGKKLRKAQEVEGAKANAQFVGKADSREAYHSGDLGVIPPPPPPHVMAHFPKDESDALSAMLMSWYMSGYHTGYYQGFTRSKATRSSHGEGRPTT